MTIPAMRVVQTTGACVFGVTERMVGTVAESVKHTAAKYQGTETKIEPAPINTKGRNKISVVSLCMSSELRTLTTVTTYNEVA
jgi:hypothetical protein